MNNDSAAKTSSDSDKDLRNSKLETLHTWLTSNISGYAALCEAGSTTAGDVWTEGRSDRDIVIIVEGLSDKIEAKIQEHLVASDFNDTYLFIIFPKERFLKTNSDQDISMKFRGQTLFGEDLVAQKETPSKEFALEIGQRGLKSMFKKFKTRLMNSGYWSEEHLKDKLYPEFKHFFMYLADIEYGKTGKYPRRRTDVAEVFNSDELRTIVNLFANFNEASKAEVIEAVKAAITYQTLVN